MRFLFIMFSLMFVVGCSSKPKEVIIVQTQYESVSLPAQYLTKCTTSEPIPIPVYLKYKSEDREAYLTRYITTILGDLKKCDNKISSINKYITNYNRKILELNNPTIVSKEK